MFADIKSPFGRIIIEERAGAIARVYLPNQTPDNYVEDDSHLIISRDPPILERACEQFEQYFNGTRRAFELPLDFGVCTDFMKRVYRELMRVPYGETVSYKYIAERIGSPKAYRAVGFANNKNSLAIIVPCHRIVGADGSLVGYAGGLELKAQLLKLER